MIVGPRYNDVDPAVEAAYQRAADPVCTCHVVPDPWTYYGAVEPGGAMEWDPECPVHLPASVTHETFTEGDAF